LDKENSVLSFIARELCFTGTVQAYGALEGRKRKDVHIRKIDNGGGGTKEDSLAGGGGGGGR